MTSPYNHSDLLPLLQNGTAKDFDAIYDRFADRLYDYVYRRIKIKEISEEIIQDIFVSLWSKRETLTITISLDAYLFGAAKFRVLTYFRSEKVRREYAANFTSFMAQCVDNSNEEAMNLKDLESSIDTSISALPEKCRTAFRLSRMEHEPISQIAERMNISRHTVENYLSQALKHLRASLGEVLVLLIWSLME